MFAYFEKLIYENKEKGILKSQHGCNRYVNNLI